MEEDVLLLLRLEHRNQARLVELLERQVEEAKGGRAIDREMAQDLADYFLGYPDLCHHPKENAVFRKLQSRDAEAAAAVGNLLAEHEEMTALTERLAGVVRRMMLEELAPGPRFAEVAGRFVETLRRHMRLEEEVFFPAVERCFTEDDWAEIDFQVFDQPDPLFSAAIERRFESLRDHIRAESTAQGRSKD